VIWKHPHLNGEFLNLPIKLQLIAVDFESLSKVYFNIIPVVTRILEYIQGSTGVHEDGRACDFRIDHAGQSLYRDDMIEGLLNMINAAHPRTDGKKVLIAHSFKGGPRHFHMQIPHDWV